MVSHARFTGCSLPAVNALLTKSPLNDSLYSIMTRRCNLSKIKDLSGKIFGDLCVIKIDPDIIYYPNYRNTRKRRRIRWICECRCKKILPIDACHLRSGAVQRCIDCSNNNRKSPDTSLKQLYHMFKWRAKRDKKVFDISLEYVRDLFYKQDGKCSYSGLALEFADSKKSHSRGWTTASIDRIDSSIGYIEGNVQWVHKNVNWMKHSMKHDEFVQMCKLIANNNAS